MGKTEQSEVTEAIKKRDKLIKEINNNYKCESIKERISELSINDYLFENSERSLWEEELYNYILESISSDKELPISDKSIEELIDILRNKLDLQVEYLSAITNFSLHNQNKRIIRLLLSRITSYIEEQCGMPSSYENYINDDLRNPYQVEHIWANSFDEHVDEFHHITDFQDFRNKIGDLILLPKNFNQSFGADPFEKKVIHYFGQNMLAKTLNYNCYSNNPGFLRYLNMSGLPFKPYEKFKKDDIIERQELYRLLCEDIWNKDSFNRYIN